ncbi:MULTISPECIES: phage head-tail connector protein [Clostridium]|uniref:Phage head-tail connector protein n=1 Tax=Clostridium frigoriphilum TaxID=443253 RepID=A0ABU7UU89_9CLOT|nr:phage head-tail connector protein [Clostridium sp. DSM 17811]MBU3098740.1 phage head-tail connector protein [Clostridium sp. DSM 17811]
MVLEDLQVILNTTTKDALLTIYIREAQDAITNYLNGSEAIDFTTLYEGAVIKYVVQCINKKGNEGLKSFGQGSVSGSYEDGLSNSIKALLPLPHIRMR